MDGSVVRTNLWIVVWVVAIATGAERRLGVVEMVDRWLEALVDEDAAAIDRVV